MEASRFPSRLYSKGNEPEAGKSIHYYAGNQKLFAALANHLLEDEREELLQSPLGVVLRFHGLEFHWASRIVHYILTAQLQCNKPHEIWCLVGCKPLRFSLLEFGEITGLNCQDVPNLDSPDVEVTDEMENFWNLLGVDVQRGPSVNELIEACGLCGDWTRLDRLRLGYLCIYAGYIEAKKENTPINVNFARLVMDTDAFQNYPWGRVALKFLIKSVKEKDLSSRSYTIEGFVQVLQVWVYYALPEYAVPYGDPFPHHPTPPLLAYQGSRGKRYMKENMYKQVNVISCVMTDNYLDMIPRWDHDVEDERITNLISALHEPGWRWNRDHWSATGVLGAGIDNRKQGRVNPTVKKESMSLTLVSAPEKRSRDDEDSEMPTWLQMVQQCFTALSEKMDKGFDHCKKKIKRLDDRMGRIEDRMEAVKPGKEEAGKNGKEEQIKSNQPAPDHHVPDGNEPAPDVNKGVPDIGSKMETQFEEGLSASITVDEPTPLVQQPQQPQHNYVEDVDGNEEKKKNAEQETVQSDSVVVLPPQKPQPIEVEKAKQEEKKNAAMKKGRSQRLRKDTVLFANQGLIFGKGYDPFGPFPAEKTRRLQEWIKKQPGYDARRKPVPFTSIEWFWILRKPQEWLKDTHMDAALNMMRKRYKDHPEWFRSDKICILDSSLANIWNMRFNDFTACEDDASGTGKKLPGGAWDYYVGELPEYAQIKKRWGTEVEDIYLPLNVKENHWVALWISIPERHITVWDSIVTHTSPEVLKEKVDPIAEMLPYLLRVACDAEDRYKWPVTPYTHERWPATTVPQNKKGGDCGVYCLKYIECHALGYSFDAAALCDAKIKQIREKFAAEIFEETEFRGADTQSYTGLDAYD